ncbi:MnhB domain-containing protein [Azovibrio restrictus]|uniref:MnhB domain-containing protein n=1 Tax=Azovibrio restrictus TaxID=146938 RepID=UPI0026EFB9B1|nr:MnhB domain-containing protein [Azovibrio restrictus]
MKKIAIQLAALVFALVLGSAMLDLDPAPVDLRPAVAAHLEASGVAHPVTAVLLNYRGYDTLLEVAVLLLALFAILAVIPDSQTGRPTPAAPVLQTLARLAVPLMLVTATFLLWAGAFRPGGAFQAGSVLAAALVLLHLTGLLAGWPQPGARLRWGLAAGFLVFLAVAAALLLQGHLLQYPPAWAGLLILCIEFALTLSLGLLLAGLFLFLSRDTEGAP